MAEKKKSVYELPRSRSLSDYGVIGQEPAGWCANGTAPIEWTCMPFGDGPAQKDVCAPTGNFPTMGGCQDGHNAVQVCMPLGSSAMPPT